MPARRHENVPGAAHERRRGEPPRRLTRRAILGVGLLLSSLLVVAPSARAELMPKAEQDFEEPLKLTFEILPAKEGASLPDDVRQIEGARMQIEKFRAQTDDFLKMTLVLPLPDGNHRERVVFFRDEDGRLRMLGFHALVRRATGPEGQTIVFDSGVRNPLAGRKIPLPGDAYSRLGLFAALRGLAATAKSSTLMLWSRGEEAVAAEVVVGGTESLFFFGSDVEALRMRVVPEGGEPDASYWFRAKPPHTFLQYEGPADFVTAEAPETRIVLRATSSSEHSRRLLEGLRSRGSSG